MDYPTIAIRPRDVTGKGVARKIRALGYIPAVIYGKDMPSTPLVVNPKEVVAVLKGPKGANTVVRLVNAQDGSDAGLAIIKDYAVDPVRRNLLHCDFMRVTEDSEVRVTVPIKTVGRSEGERAGGTLHMVLRTTKVACQVRNIPEAITIDVTPLRSGQVLMLSELPLPPGVRAIYRKDTPVLVIKAGRAEKTGEGPAQAAPAQKK